MQGTDFSCISKSFLVGLVFLLGGFQQIQAADNNGAITWKIAVAASLSLIYLTNGLETDRMTFELGTADGVNAARIGAQWDWKEDILDVFGFSLDTYLQADYTKWQSSSDSTQQGSSNSLGFTPVFRFSRDLDSVTPYIETGIGVAVFSRSEFEDYDFGSNLQFGDMLGTGVFFGKHRQWGLGYKFQHYSNNSLALPNNGINYHYLTLAYQYE